MLAENVNDWISFDDFVDRVRNHHHGGFTGLVTGISDRQHAFKVGFDRGDIVLLTYRIKKGMPALQLMTQMRQTKITEYPANETQYVMEGIPDTAAILSQLTANTRDDTTTTDISEVPDLQQRRDVSVRALDPMMRKSIESAAVHFFGPIGAMVCDEALQDYQGDLREVVLTIAQEVGASDSDTRAFFDSIAAR